ncbi:hypothetical protein GLA29479_1403 [Lysobacter antibioticus]|uniref:hypothetical protein n=1 Tax=Lysobacter antibioticus TaxID=84531 RepID=UPI0007228FC4|nr:hypothetical protein [Lysobacter antibioticus]ALN62286.1 hypothetical protein GLA29479_1403 [Lysobacter antibioticus]
MAIKKQRSPSYPAITLQEAIERAKAFYKKEGKHETLVFTAMSHWGYSSKSSGGLVTVAALKAYGLMGDKGSGSERKVFLTPFGLKIIMDERIVSPDRDAAIKQAAMTPKILAELWNKYGSDLPSHDTLRHFLRVDKEYSDSAVKEVIKVYLANLDYAKLNSSDVVETADTDETTDSNDESDSSNSSGEQSQEAPYVSPFMPSMPPAARPGAFATYIGEEIANYRVSKTTTIRLVANGPYSRKSMEGLVKQIQLAIELGNFDDLPEDES